MEMHIFKLHPPRNSPNIFCIDPIFNLRAAVHQREHILQIRHCLFNLAVCKAENIKRAVELHHDQGHRRYVTNGQVA